MGEIDRIWQKIKREFVGGETPQSDDDPEHLLAAAVTAMKAMHRRSYERTGIAVAQTNKLQMMVDEMVQRIGELNIRAETAGAQGRTDDAIRLMREKASYDQTLEMTRRQLEQSVETVEQCKTALRLEEEKVRRKTAEAMTLRAQWRLIQMEQSLTRSMTESAAGLADRLTREEIAARHHRNREFAMEAITFKNGVEAIVDGTEKSLAGLREKADAARREGDGERERQVLREMEQFEANMANTRISLTRAQQIADHARALLQEDEQRLQRAAAPTPHVNGIARAPEVKRTRAGQKPDDWEIAAWFAALAAIIVIIVVVLLWLTRP